MDLEERVRAAVKALESIAADWTLLDLLPAEDRERLQKAVAAIHNPDRVARRRRLKEARRAQRTAADPARGGRAARHRASGRCAASRCSRRRTCFRRTRDRTLTAEASLERQAALLRLQEEVHAGAPFLRPAVPALRRAEFPQAHRAGRPARARRAADRRAGEDRLPGRAQAAALRGRADRHHALSARLRAALRERAGFRRMGASAGDLRARPAPYAERGGVLPAAAGARARGSTSSSTTPARRCGGRRSSTST